jgi:hypothetical protein
MDAAVSALLGAAIGAVPSFIAMMVQSRMKDKRDRSKQLTDLSIVQYKAHLDQVMAGKGGRSILPLSVYLYHNDLVLKAIEAGSYTPEKVREIDATMEQIDAASSPPRKVSEASK